MLLPTSFLISVKTQEETLFHKKVEPVTKTAPEKSNSSVGKSEEEAQKIQISSRSTRDSEKVGGSNVLTVKSDDLLSCQSMLCICAS